MKNLWHGELVRAGLGRRVVATGTKGVSGLLMVLSLALILGSPMAFAQQGDGRVSGTVRDTSGAVVPGASVVLHNEASSAELKTTSDASGLFDFNYIPVATYTLRVSTKGFKEYVLTGIHVAPGSVLQEDATLQVGTQVETIEVKSAAVDLIPKSTGGQMPTIGAAQIQNESTIGRDALELLTLLPGVVGGTGTPGSVSGGFNGASGTGFQTVGGVNTEGINGFNVNGLRNDQNMVTLDNANTIDPGENGGFMIEPNMDMIQEFTVKMSGFEASQGGGGIIVEAVTKSGGSRIHGEGYYYARNAFFNANDWSNNQAGIAKPASKFNYPGFNIGGPVRIPGTNFNKNNDKMFFFYGVEWQRQLADPGTQFRTVPTAAMRNGDFSGLLNTKFCQTNAQGVVTGGNYLSMPCIVTDPATKKQADYDGQLNVLPPGEVTAAGQTLLNGTYVLPNYVDPTGNSNLAAHPLYPTNRIENTGRIDYNLTQNTRAFLRLAQNSDHEYYPYGLWASGLGDGWGGNVPRVSPVVGHDSGENASINVVKVINPTLTNEVQFSMGAINYPYKYADPSKMASSDLLKVLPGVNWALGTGGSDFTRTVEVPGVWNGQAPNSQTWGQGDQYNGIYGDKTTFELTDNLTKVKGTHTLQFGFAMNHTRNDQNQANVNGSIWSNVGWAGVTSTGNVFGDLLDQSVYQWSQSTNDPDGMWRFWNYEWYAQDSWKVNRKLTLNYGARFAYFPPWREARGEVANFNPAVYSAANDSSINDGVQVGRGIGLVEKAAYFPQGAAGQFATGAPDSGGFPNPPVVIEPRLGFAYDLFGTGKTVLRAGAGVYEERDQGNTIFGAAQNPPFEFSTSISSSTRYDPTAANPALTGFGYYSTVNPFSSIGSISATAYDTTDNHGAENYSWNFTVDQDIGLKTIVEAAYVGTVGRHLYIENIIPGSAIPLGTLWASGTMNDIANAGNSGVQNSYRYYKPFGAIDLLHHVSTSNYNGLQLTARRNVTHGLTLLTSYTWSKTLGYAGGFNGVVDPFNSRLNYGLTSYSLPQILNVSYIYQLPDAGTKYFNGNKVAGGFLNGWQLSGITNFQSGAPQFSIGGAGVATTFGTVNCYEGGVQNAGLCANFNGNGTGWYGTPDRSLYPTILFNPQKGVNFKGVGSQWFNPASITLPQINQLGTTEVPQFLGPGSNNFDFTLFKSFKLDEQRRLEFRIAAFDIFNRAQLDTPAQDGVANPNINWMLPAGATSMSQGVASSVLNASSTCSGGNTVGCILSKHGHREMEMALKFYF